MVETTVRGVLLATFDECNSLLSQLFLVRFLRRQKARFTPPPVMDDLVERDRGAGELRTHDTPQGFHLLLVGRVRDGRSARRHRCPLDLFE